jgi:hypothetical protein
MSRGTRFAIAVAALEVLAGCTVGSGSGGATGLLYVKDCSPGGDYGDFGAPAMYDLHPEFFAAEPIEDIRPGGGENRLVVRVETFEKSIRRSRGVAEVGPFKDTVVFDMRVLKVAMCVRAAALGVPDPMMAGFCQITPGDPVPRIRVGPEQPIRAAFGPRKTCPKNIYVVGTARGDDMPVNGVIPPLPPEQWPSWVKLRKFGSADRGVNQDFKVEFGDQVHAELFHLELTDNRILQAPKLDEPAPQSEIHGHLDGYFDFDLERGQGAQTFP